MECSHVLDMHTHTQSAFCNVAKTVIVHLQEKKQR